MVHALGSDLQYNSISKRRNSWHALKNSLRGGSRVLTTHAIQHKTTLPQHSMLISSLSELAGLPPLHTSLSHSRQNPISPQQSCAAITALIGCTPIQTHPLDTMPFSMRALPKLYITAIAVQHACGPTPKASALAVSTASSHTSLSIEAPQTEPTSLSIEVPQTEHTTHPRTANVVLCLQPPLPLISWRRPAPDTSDTTPYTTPTSARSSLFRPIDTTRTRSVSRAVTARMAKPPIHSGLKCHASTF